MLDRSNVFFDRSNLFFDWLKICQGVFFKHELFTCSSLFQTFQKLFSLSLFDQSKFKDNFLSFSLKFFSRFLSSSTGKTILPFLFGLISFFMHFFMHFREIFELNKIWGFWCFSWFLSQLINGFLLLDDINMFFMVYFDQFGGLGRIENSRACNSTDLGILFNWD